MNFLDSSVLTLVTFLPLVAAVVLLLLPKDEKLTRWFSLYSSSFIFLLSLYLPWRFGQFQEMHTEAEHRLFHFELDQQWIQSLNIHYHMGLDGISLWLVVLTTFLVPLGVLISWRSVHDRVRTFFVLLLILETAMLGVFLALDLFLFYVFWEATLIPMALLIGMYGHERRVYAAVKFFLYTMVGSVFMLAAIIWLYVHTGTFDYENTRAALADGTLPGFAAAAPILFLGFFIAFAVKVPLFPLHTWLPDAHVEAPTAGSVLLAGVLLKMGTYGLLRFNVGLFPGQAREHAPWIVTLALIGIIYGALVSMVQPNLKKLVAYSSVSHLGFVVLGIFSFTQAGIDGAVYQMLNHGVSTGALFMLVGLLYERRHTFEISQYGGVATPMPNYATLFLIITLSSIGLPLMNGFVGEFLVLSGSFQARPLWGILGATGVIWSACYMLWMYQRVFYGQNTNPANQALRDVTRRERLALWPTAIMALVMGVASPYWINQISPAVQATALPEQPYRSPYKRPVKKAEKTPAAAPAASATTTEGATH